MPPITYFLYTRKSTDTEDRQVYSIDHQIAELRALACRKNLEVVGEFTENRTAKAPGRPVFRDMLARIKRGEASGILSWSPDRLARNSVDGGQIIHFLDTNALRDLQFPTHTFESTSAGKLMLSVLFGMSKYYTDSLADNIKRAIRQRIQHGYWARRPPLGYCFDRNTRTAIPDLQRAPLVCQIFERYSTGEYTFDQLVGVGASLGLRGRPSRHGISKSLSASQLQYLLQNPFYAGMLRLHGELYEGKQEPLVSNQLFDACQRVMAERGRYKHSSRASFLYRGMMRCGECGCVITMETQKGHTYLRCTKRKRPCSQPYLRAEAAADQIAKAVKSLAIPQDIANGMIQELKRKQVVETAASANECSTIQGKLAIFDAKFQRLTDLYIDGAMTPAEFKKTKEKILKGKRTLADKLNFLQHHRTTRFEPAIAFIRGSTKALTVADSGDRVAQRDFLQKAGSNFFLSNGEVCWEGRGPWKDVAAAGFFGPRTPAPPVTTATAHASYPTWSAESPLTRTLFQSITAFFAENPTWV